MSSLSQASRPAAAHLAIVFLAWGVWLTGFFSLTLGSFVVSQIREAFAASDREVALLTGLAIGATGLGGFLFGALADRLGRKRSMAVAVTTFCLGNLACALAPSLGWLMVARGIAGIGIGGSWGAGQTLIGETVPPALRGRLGAVAQTGAPLGLGAAALVGAFLVPTWGYQAAFALAVLPLLLLALLRFVPESDLWKPQAPQAGSLRQLLAGSAGATFWKCQLLTLLNMSNYWFAISWLPQYLQQERGLSAARSGTATLVFVCGSLTGYLAFGVLSDRWGRRRSFTLFSSIMAGGLLMFTVFWPLVAGTPGLVLVFLFISGLGTGTWSAYGPMFSELFPTALRGSALSIIMNLARGVQFLAPVVITAVAPRWGMAGGIALGAGFAVAAALWIWTLPETRGRVIT